MLSICNAKCLQTNSTSAVFCWILRDAFILHILLICWTQEFFSCLKKDNSVFFSASVKGDIITERSHVKNRDVTQGQAETLTHLLMIWAASHRSSIVNVCLGVCECLCFPVRSQVYRGSYTDLLNYCTCNPAPQPPSILHTHINSNSKVTQITIHHNETQN